MLKRNINFCLVICIAAILLIGFQATAGELATWTGWYAGAYGGHMSGKLNSDDPTHAESTKDYKDDMPMIGIDGGYYHEYKNG
jgi:hypothetical protein